MIPILQSVYYYSWHKWAGVTIFLLALFRLAWRVTHQPPPLPDHLPKLMHHSPVRLADEFGQWLPDGLVRRVADS